MIPRVSSPLSFMAKEHCMPWIWYGLAISLAYSIGRTGVISAFQWFLPAFPTCRERGGEGRHPMVLCTVYMRMEMGEGVQGDGSSVYCTPLIQLRDLVMKYLTCRKWEKTGSRLQPWSSEPVFVNNEGAQKSIPRNRFSVAGRYVK
jgi:hypothetical protein